MRDCPEYVSNVSYKTLLTEKYGIIENLQSQTTRVIVFPSFTGRSNKMLTYCSWRFCVRLWRFFHKKTPEASDSISGADRRFCLKRLIKPLVWPPGICISLCRQWLKMNETVYNITNVIIAASSLWIFTMSSRVHESRINTRTANKMLRGPLEVMKSRYYVVRQRRRDRFIKKVNIHDKNHWDLGTFMNWKL